MPFLPTPPVFHERIFEHDDIRFARQCERGVPRKEAQMTPRIIHTGRSWTEPVSPMTAWQREKAYGPVQPMQKEKKWWKLWN